MKDYFVYFILDTETNLIKIGYTAESCPNVRLSSAAKTWHQVGKFPAAYRLLGVINTDDGRFLKMQLHAQFAKWHKGHEWFDPVPPLRLYISENSSGHACDGCMTSEAEWRLRNDQANEAVKQIFAKINHVGASNPVACHPRNLS